MATGGGESLKVFCSYRSTDAAVVEAFATRLAGAGLEAWFDRWEIRAGDDIVARMDEGLDGCDAALIFISEAWFDGTWAYDEYTTLAMRKVEDGIRVIPVMLADVAARLPGRLRKLARRSDGDFEAIRDTLLGVDRRPGVANAQQAPTRHVEVVLAEAGAGRLSSELMVDGQSLARAEARVPSGWDLGQATSAPLLAELGRRVGAAVLAGEVGTALEMLLGDLGGAVVDLCVSAPPALMTLPFEAACLPGGAPLALAAPVRMWRRVRDGADRPALAPPPAPGPLKILVAVGAPDEGQTPAQPLDIEAEMGSILDAVGDAVRDERAQVRFLEATDVSSIAAALAEDDYHVLHISGHGRGEAVELADEDGAAVAVTAAQLVGALQEAGKVLPLVFVSACAGGDHAPGFAYDLSRHGVARVVAMTTTVTDAYATRLAAAFYRHLSIAPWPRAAVALAAARRQLAAAPPDRTPPPRPEWATPTLLLGGDDGPLLDVDLPQVSLRRPPVHAVGGPVPPVALGYLIGRRPQVRTTLRALRAHPRFATEYAAVGGVALTGTGEWASPPWRAGSWHAWPRPAGCARRWRAT